MKPNGLCELADSGARRTFETGATRDISVGKGRCDLLPLDIVSSLIGDDSGILNRLESFKNYKYLSYIYDALDLFMIRNYPSDNTKFSYGEAMLELSKHFESGAIKYSANNWKKGIPVHCYIDSGARHYIKFFRGDTDEPHDRAFMWNMVCAIWTMEHKPELDDIEHYAEPATTSAKKDTYNDETAFTRPFNKTYIGD